MAAKEDLENADSMMANIREGEARLRDETQRIMQLSEFVKHKDADAQSKLSLAQELSKRLEVMDLAVKEENEISVMQQEELASQRLHLLRERVALLKNRSNDREQNILPKYSNESALANDFSTIQPSIRRALRSMKSDLNRLSD